MRRKRLEIPNSFFLLLLRLALLYVIMGLCRVLFYVYNADILAPVTLKALPSILKGSFIFDTASIFYVNILFIFLSLIPFYFREKDWWQRLLGILFTLSNSGAILVNLADVFYFPYKLTRIAGDDLRYFSEDNFSTLFLSFLVQYWWGVLILISFMILLYQIGFVKLRIKKGVRFVLHKPFFYISQTVIMVLSLFFAIVAIRGFTMSKATFPITMSDATLYVDSKYASLILSNPFCVIRTAGNTLETTKYMSDAESEKLYSPIKQVIPSIYDIKGMNIMLIVLESFGSGHIKSLSDRFNADSPSFTPFLDSLSEHGTLMTSAYQSGGRSIDAMPAIWGSIPSFKKNFLSLAQSASTYNALPAILREMGYTTSFMHGATRSSMSFKAFGQMAGVSEFVAQEDYEQSNGTNDFDGKWGIWDHKFLPFAISKIDQMKKPFFNTIFTLSSHNPYALPPGFEHKYPKGKEQIEETIAYSDDALRSFFNQAKGKDWYNNTLFILTADHGSGADNAKWKGVPYNYRVPILFFTPSGVLPAQRIDKVASHVDLMPTILAMMAYDKPFFSYGEPLFEESKREPFVVNNNMGTFNVVTKTLLYQFNDIELVGVYDYTNDNELKKNLKNNAIVSTSDITFYKAYIQNYYTRVKGRRFLAE